MTVLTVAQDNVLETLKRNEWMALQQLSSQASLPLLDLPALLLDLSERGLVEQKEGLWKRVEPQRPAQPAAAVATPEAGQKPLVIVDLGNVHDCLQKLVPLADAGCVDVRAYADLHYNGFGVQPPLASLSVRVEQARVSHKNAADTRLVWDLALLCADGAAGKRTIFIATKDNGFRHLQELAAELGHRVFFCENWGSFKAAFEKTLPGVAGGA
jgi:hypothetical protein